MGPTWHSVMIKR